MHIFGVQVKRLKKNLDLKIVKEILTFKKLLPSLLKTSIIDVKFNLKSFFKPFMTLNHGLYNLDLPDSFTKKTNFLK